METRQALRSVVFSAQPHYWAHRILLAVKRQFILVREWKKKWISRCSWMQCWQPSHAKNWLKKPPNRRYRPSPPEHVGGFSIISFIVWRSIKRHVSYFEWNNTYDGKVNEKSAIIHELLLNLSKYVQFDMTYPKFSPPSFILSSIWSVYLLWLWHLQREFWSKLSLSNLSLCWMCQIRAG